MRRPSFVQNSVAFVCLIISISCFLVVLLSVLRLPEVSTEISGISLFGGQTSYRKFLEKESIGKFGGMIVEMLPQDLAFTVFIPSEEAFGRDLGLKVDGSLTAEKANDTYAVLTRILGFSAVPRKIPSAALPSGKEIRFDSLSGFGLYISKDSDGVVVVNRIRSEKVDLNKGEIVIHVMNGVIMDAEFEQSVHTGEED